MDYICLIKITFNWYGPIKKWLRASFIHSFVHALNNCILKTHYDVNAGIFSTRRTKWPTLKSFCSENSPRETEPWPPRASWCPRATASLSWGHHAQQVILNVSKLWIYILSFVFFLHLFKKTLVCSAMWLPTGQLQHGPQAAGRAEHKLNGAHHTPLWSPRTFHDFSQRDISISGSELLMPIAFY